MKKILTTGLVALTLASCSVESEVGLSAELVIDQTEPQTSEPENLSYDTILDEKKHPTGQRDEQGFLYAKCWKLDAEKISMNEDYSRDGSVYTFSFNTKQGIEFAVDYESPTSADRQFTNNNIVGFHLGEYEGSYDKLNILKNLVAGGPSDPDFRKKNIPYVDAANVERTMIGCLTLDLANAKYSVVRLNEENRRQRMTDLYNAFQDEVIKEQP